LIIHGKIQPQLDISPSSYHEVYTIDSTLLGSTTFLQPQGCFCLGYHIFLLVGISTNNNTSELRDNNMNYSHDLRKLMLSSIALRGMGSSYKRKLALLISISTSVQGKSHPLVS